MRRAVLSLVVMAAVALPAQAPAGTGELTWVVDHLSAETAESGFASVAVNLGTEIARPGERIPLRPTVIGESILPELSIYTDEDELPRNLPPLDPLNPLAGETNLIDVSEVSAALGAVALSDLDSDAEAVLQGPTLVFFAMEIDGECDDPGSPVLGLAFSGLFDEPWEQGDLSPTLAPLQGFGRMVTIDCSEGDPRLMGIRHGEFGDRTFETGALGWVGDGIGVIGLPYEELRGPQAVLFAGRGTDQPVETHPAYGPDDPVTMAVPDVYFELGADGGTDLDVVLLQWLFGPSGNETVCIPPGFRRIALASMPGGIAGMDVWSSLTMSGEPGEGEQTLSGTGPDYEFELRVGLDGSVTFTKTGADGSGCIQEGSTEFVESIIPELSSSFPGTVSEGDADPPAEGTDGGFPWPLWIVVGLSLLVAAWVWSHRPRSKSELAIKVDGGDEFIEYPDGTDADGTDD